jgi:hypothetical protein
MSGTMSDLDLQEQIARIRRTQEEIDKLFAEAGKLRAEEAKLRRDPVISAMAAAGALMTAGAALCGLILKMTGRL